MNSARNLYGACANVGAGPRFDLLDIGHPEYVAVVAADSAFWTLVPKDQAVALLLGEDLSRAFLQRQESFDQEMQALRFGLTPSAVYFNPTERCNLNCQYCYLPEEMRRSGVDMADADLHRALEILADYFQSTLPAGSVPPQIIFHGSEPMLRREAVFAAIEKYPPGSQAPAWEPMNAKLPLRSASENPQPVSLFTFPLLPQRLPGLGHRLLRADLIPGLDDHAILINEKG